MKSKLVLVFIALFFASLVALMMQGDGEQEIAREQEIKVEYNFFSFPIEKEIVFNGQTKKTFDWGMTGTMAIVLILIFFIVRAIRRILWSKRKRRNPWKT